MSKQIYIDSEGNEIQVSGTVNSADMMPMSASDSTKVKTAIGDLSQLTTTDKSSLVGAVKEVDTRVKALNPPSKEFGTGTTTAQAISDYITTYGKVSMMFAFIITGTGWFECILKFYSDTQGGGVLIQNGGNPRLWAVSYQNGTVNLSEK